MTRTFLVAVSLAESDDITLIAEDIKEELDLAFEVLSVKPWAAPLSNPWSPPDNGSFPPISGQ